MLRLSLLSLLALSLPAQTPATPVQAPAPPADPIIARVAGKPVHQSEVDAAIASMPAQKQQQLLMVEGAREHYTQQFLEMALLAAKAEKDGIAKTPTFQRLMADARNQILASELVKRDGESLQARMKLTDEGVKAYYEAHKDRFMTKGKFTARHILVSVKSDRNPTGLSEEEAKAKVAKAQEALKAGQKLEDLAKDYSDDPGSKDKGGLYENIDFGSFVPEFEQAVKTQELGKPGDPIRTSYGFHIIQAESRVNPEQKPFEAAQEEVRQMATQAKQEEVWGGYIASLKNEISFEIGDRPQPTKAGKAAKPSKTTKVAAKGKAQ